MVNSDFNVLCSLLEQYPLKEVILGLALAAKVKADELSDLGLKERAAELANGSDHLHDVAVDL